MAWQWLRQHLSRPDHEGVYDRLREWWHHLLNPQILKKKKAKQSLLFSHWQSNCPELFPGLRSIPIWDTTELPWIKIIEGHFEVIRSELLGIRSTDSTESLFQPYRKPCTSSLPNSNSDFGSNATNDKGDWNVLYLSLHSTLPDLLSRNRSHFPKTLALIEDTLSTFVHPYNHAFVSAISSNTHIQKHCGPTNKKLRCHLPLVVPPGSQCELRVGGEFAQVKEGKCIVFDDSFEHEAWNRFDDNSENGKQNDSLSVGQGSRIVLVFDIWHVDFSKEEVKFLDFLQKSQFRRLKKEQKEGDYLHIIDKARYLTVNEEVIWES